MAFFLIILVVPLLIAIGSFVFLDGISWKEFLVQVGAQVLIAAMSVGITSCANTHDTEILNGRVTGKTRDRVSCSHSYSCHCHQECSGSGKNRSCSEHCDTCYEHLYDVDWNVSSTVGGFTIDRIDRQGLDQPPRWTSTVINEPVSVEHSYDNYVKAAPGTLFRHQGLTEKYAASLPENPQRIYDYWHLNRLLSVGVPIDDARAWNSDLMQLNADLGAPKQANIIVVLVKNLPIDWYSALEEKWIGGKKNDVVLIVSVDEAMKPQWASVMCWTTNELFKIKLRDDVMNDPSITREAVMADLRTNVSQYFVRKPMKDFEYLRSEITPTQTEWVITLAIGLLVAVGLAWFFEVNDVFGDEGSTYSYNSRSSVSYRSIYSTDGEALDAFLPWYRRRGTSKRKRSGTHGGGAW